MTTLRFECKVCIEAALKFKIFVLVQIIAIVFLGAFSFVQSDCCSEDKTYFALDSDPHSGPSDESDQSDCCEDQNCCSCHSNNNSLFAEDIYFSCPNDNCFLLWHDKAVNLVFLSSLTRPPIS